MSAMPIGRITEICSGHTCWPPTIAIQGSSNVFAEMLPVHRVGDAYIPLCCPTPSGPQCHPVITARASPSVFTNNKATSHIGSSTGCSSMNIMITGAPTVWVEGQ